MSTTPRHDRHHLSGKRLAQRNVLCAALFLPFCAGITCGSEPPRANTNDSKTPAAAADRNETPGDSPIGTSTLAGEAAEKQGRYAEALTAYQKALSLADK